MTRRTERLLTAAVALALAVLYWWYSQPPEFTPTPERGRCPVVITGGVVPQLCEDIERPETCRRITAAEAAHYARQARDHRR